MSNNFVITIPLTIYMNHAKEFVIGATRIDLKMDYNSKGVTGYIFELPYILIGIQEVDNQYIQLTLAQDYSIDLLDPNQHKMKGTTEEEQQKVYI